MGEDRLLGFGGNPVEQVHGFGFAVVVSGNLLVEELDEEGLEVKVGG